MTNYFNEASILKIINISIDDVLINNDNLIKCKMEWNTDSFDINGELIISDDYDLGSSLPLNGNNIVKIYIMDMFNEFFVRDFVITRFDEQIVNEKMKHFKFYLRDNISHTLDNLYISKSFSNKKLSDIIDTYWEHFDFDSILTIPNIVDRKFSDTKIVHENITVPQNISFLEFMYNELKKEGFKWYQYRTECIIVNEDDIVSSKLSSDIDVSDLEFKTYSEHELKSEYLFNIFERNHTSNYIMNAQELPSRINSYYDSDTKSFIKTNENLIDIYDDIKLNDYDSSDVQTYASQNGSQLVEHFQNNDFIIKKNLRDTFNSNNLVQIYVSGNIKYSTVLSKIYLKLKGSANSNTTLLEGDARLQSFYVCSKITDILINGKMVQELTLKRVDFTKPKG